MCIYALSCTIDLLTWYSRNVFACCAVTISQEDNGHHSKHSPFLLSSSSFYCWAWHLMVMGHFFGQLGQLSGLCPLPATCAAPVPCWQGSMRSRKSFSIQDCSATTITSVCCYHYFHQKSKPQYSTILYNGNEIYPREKQDNILPLPFATATPGASAQVPPKPIPALLAIANAAAFAGLPAFCCFPRWKCDSCF